MNGYSENKQGPITFLHVILERSEESHVAGEETPQRARRSLFLLPFIVGRVSCAHHLPHGPFLDSTGVSSEGRESALTSLKVKSP